MTEYDQKKRPGNETREKILNAAISIFGRKGYRNTTLKDVAQVVGISHVLVLKYFESKENLLSEAYLYATANSYSLPEREMNLRERVELLVKQSVDVMNKKPEQFDFFMMLLCTSDLPETYQMARRVFFSKAPIYTVIEAWQKQRTLPDNHYFDYFMTFMRTVYMMLDFYRRMFHLQDLQGLNAEVLLSYIVQMINKEVKNKPAKNDL